MKTFLRIAAFMLMLMLVCPVALAAKATPTPPPVQIDTALAEAPAEIRRMLDIAYEEWKTLDGKKLPNVNKFTEWRGKGYKFEWCAGYVTWVMMEAGIPMEELADIKAKGDKNDIWHVDGLYHCKEASPGKLLRAYQIMERTTMVPQEGFIVIYGCGFNKVIHAAIVYDVEDLGGGKYRLTTLEGNIKDSIKMYVRDYDMNAEVNTNRLKSTNLTQVPEGERNVEGADYTLMDGKPSNSTSSRYMYYVNRFLMPWVPGDPALTTPAPTAEPTPELTAEPTPAPTATPTMAPTATPTVTPAPTEAPAEDAEEPVIADVIVLTPPPAVTTAPEVTAAPVVTEAPTAEPTAEPTPEPTAEPTVEPTATPAPTEEPAAEPTPVPVEEPTWPCQGEDGKCSYITRAEDDPFCRKCDRNDNGVEDVKE